MSEGFIKVLPLPASNQEHRRRTRMRLDHVVSHAFAEPIRQARRRILAGLVKVDGAAVAVPSWQVWHTERARGPTMSRRSVQCSAAAALVVLTSGLACVGTARCRACACGWHAAQATVQPIDPHAQTDGHALPRTLDPTVSPDPAFENILLHAWHLVKSAASRLPRLRLRTTGGGLRRSLSV